MLRQLVQAGIIEAEPREHGQHHAGGASLAAVVPAGIEVDAAIAPEAGIEKDAAAADGLPVARRQTQAAQEHQRVSSGGPLRVVDAVGPAAVRILQLEEFGAPPFFGDAALLAGGAQDLPPDGGVAGEEPIEIRVRHCITGISRLS